MKTIDPNGSVAKTAPRTVAINGEAYGIHHEAPTTAVVDLQNGVASEATKAQLAKARDPVNRKRTDKLLETNSLLTWAYDLARYDEHVAGQLTNGCMLTVPDPKALRNLADTRAKYEEGAKTSRPIQDVRKFVEARGGRLPSTMKNLAVVFRADANSDRFVRVAFNREDDTANKLTGGGAEVLLDLIAADAEGRLLSRFDEREFGRRIAAEVKELRKAGIPVETLKKLNDRGAMYGTGYFRLTRAVSIVEMEVF